MILLLDAIEIRRITEGAMKAEVAFVVFKELETNDVHKLAGLAVERISWGLRELRRVVESKADESKIRDQQGPHASIQGSNQSAAPGAGPVDTVMGNTGLLLLEDPGLQAFVHEDWAPIAWAIPEGRTPSTKEEEYHFQGGARQRDGLDSKLSSEHINGFRSVEILKGTQRSTRMRSTPTRYTTPSEDGQQPHGYTAPASPTNLGSSQNDMQKIPVTGFHDQQTPQGYYERNPHRVMHAQMNKSVSATEPTSGSQWEYTGFPTTSNTTKSDDNPALTSSDPHHHIQSMQLRHNSCPTLHQPTVDPPLRPIYSSPNSTCDRPATTHMLPHGTPLRNTVSVSLGMDPASFHTYLETLPQSGMPHVGNLSVHPPFAARPAASISSMADHAAMNFSPTSADQAQTTHDMAQGQQQHAGYPLAVQFTNMTTEAMTGFAEHVSLEEWQRRMGVS